MTFDVLICGGEVIDGENNPPKQVDVGITDGKIAAVGDLSSSQSGRTVDASGKVVSPGFIDMHSHADSTIHIYPSAENFLFQGVTTTVTGNCGFAPAPLTDYYAAGFWEWNWWEEVNPRKYDQEPIADLEKVRRAMQKHEGADIEWDTFASFLEYLKEQGTSINMAPLLGHNTIRTAAMGHDYRRHANQDEIDHMKSLVREGMQAGAIGISNGLDYAPGAFASREELVEVVGQAADCDGIFATHWRRTGLRQGTGSPVMIRGLTEALEIASEAEAEQVQISHLLPGYAVFPNPPGQLRKASAELTIELLEEAIDEGTEVYWDVIPNTSGGVISSRYLVNLLSPWLKQAETPERFARNLCAPDLQDEIREYLESGNWYTLNPVSNPGWASGILISRHVNDDLVDRTLQEIADERSEDALSVLFSVLIEDPYTRSFPASGSAEGLKVFIEHPRTTIGLDTFAFDTTYEVTSPPFYLPHPNTYGGMPRFFNEFGIPQLGLQEAVHRVTGLPADILGLKNRGKIARGCWADIAIFSPDAYNGQADFAEPRQYAQGIDYLLVNGKFSIDGGTLTDDKSGRTITR